MDYSFFFEIRAYIFRDMLLSHKIHSHNQRHDKNPPLPMKITEAIRVPLARASSVEIGHDWKSYASSENKFISVTFNFLTAKIQSF